MSRSCRRSCPRPPSKPASCARSCPSSHAERGSPGRWPDAGAIREMDGALQLLIYVVVHLVAADAELLRIGEFKRGVEGAPEQHAADESAKSQKAETEMRSWGGSQCSRTTTTTISDVPCPTHLFNSGVSQHVGEGVGNEGPCVGLLDVTGRAEIAPWRDVGQDLAVPVHEVRDADHRCAGAFGELAPVAFQAAVGSGA